MAVTGAAIVVVWLADVFAIITLASRAFAGYYFIQVMMVFLVLATDRLIPRRAARLAGYGILLVFLAFVVIFAIPVDS